MYSSKNMSRYIPGGTPFEPVIGKEGFDTKAVDAATPPTAAATGAFSIKKSKISLRASMLSLVVVCSCLQIGLQLIVTFTIPIIRPKVARLHVVSFQAISVRPCTTEKSMLNYVNANCFIGTSTINSSSNKKSYLPKAH